MQTNKALQQENSCQERIPSNEEKEILLEVRDVKKWFPGGGKDHYVKAVDGVSLSIRKGETFGLVGESGCGKSTLSRLILSLYQATAGDVLFHGRSLYQMRKSELRDVRKDMQVIFQDPMNCLDPVIRVGKQIVEMILEHEQMTKQEAWQEAIRLLRIVGIPDPEARMQSYPHQLSGGMCQRVMIAMAIACKPKLLLADEPTTALDVTIQAQILKLLKKIRDEFGTSIIIVTHDLGVVATLAQRIAVFYGGRVVEEGSTREIFKNPSHPYTKGLIRCVPSLSAGTEDLNVIEGSVPDLSNMPEGCPFHPRCTLADDACRSGEPEGFEAGAGHHVLCRHYRQAAGL